MKLIPETDKLAERFLVQAGLPQLTKRKSVEEALDKSGLTIPNAIARLHEIVHYSDEPAPKLRAIELVLKLHGVLEPEAISGDTTITFNIGAVNTVDLRSVNLNSVLSPRNHV